CLKFNNNIIAHNRAKLINWLRTVYICNCLRFDAPIYHGRRTVEFFRNDIPLLFSLLHLLFVSFINRPVSRFNGGERRQVSRLFADIMKACNKVRNFISRYYPVMFSTLLIFIYF
ncbi:hypothetical protein L9F63_000759, partial [Diploptera punctata]